MKSKCSNLKIISKEKIDYLNNNYTINIIDKNGYVVHSKKGNKTTYHIPGKKWIINIKNPNIDLAVTQEHVDMWISNFKDTKYTLFDTINAMNICILSYQDITVENVKNQLLVLEKGEL